MTKRATHKKKRSANKTSHSLSYLEAYMKKRPMYIKKRPMYMKKRPMHVQKRPMYMKKRPMHVQKRPMYMKKRPMHVQKRPGNKIVSLSIKLQDRDRVEPLEIYGPAGLRALLRITLQVRTIKLLRARAVLQHVAVKRSQCPNVTIFKRHYLHK